MYTFASGKEKWLNNNNKTADYSTLKFEPAWFQKECVMESTTSGKVIIVKAAWRKIEMVTRVPPSSSSIENSPFIDFTLKPLIARYRLWRKFISLPAKIPLLDAAWWVNQVAQNDFIQDITVDRFNKTALSRPEKREPVRKYFNDKSFQLSFSLLFLFSFFLLLGWGLKPNVGKSSCHLDRNSIIRLTTGRIWYSYFHST